MTHLNTYLCGLMRLGLRIKGDGKHTVSVSSALVSLSFTHTHTHINLDCMMLTFRVSLAPLHGNHPRKWNGRKMKWKWKGKSLSRVRFFATPWTIQSIPGLPVSPCSLWVLTRLYKNRSLWSLSFCLQHLLSVCKSGSWFRDHEI